MKITTITTPFILNISVNCYLIALGDGFILVDTAKTGQRSAVEQALIAAGCVPGTLKLIALTHGDFDHCGNAAYLRQKYGAPIALHSADRGMVENGDMFASRKQPNTVMKSIVGLIFSLSQEDRFTPDRWLAEGDTLADCGLDARVIGLPGHCRGNIGLLCADGTLFCGDLLGNTGKPQMWSLVDDAAAMRDSVEKLRPLPITTVYPGHGKSFTMTEFWAVNP
jgi:glyoxylase-like metal-dependent hydrolase (beta-lactamase superfamily II)